MNGNSMKCYENNILQLTVNLPGGFTSYSETGTYLFYIGGATAVGGIMWYFVITDDSAFQSSLISTSTTSNCLTPACKDSNGNALGSYSPATVDPYLGTGYMSLVLSLDNSSGSACSSSTLSCYGSIILACACNNGSCYFDTTTNSNMCWCPVGLTPSTASCCTTGYYQVGEVCCEDSCESCSGGTAVCLTCIASNAVASPGGGCECSPGYYGAIPLVSAGACSACYSECMSCAEANTCLSCVAANASPGPSVGCTCDEGFYGIGPLVTASSCAACYSECESCNQESICLTCRAEKACPSTSLGCTCSEGFYGIAPLSRVDSCKTCYSECRSCDQGSLCLVCVADNASPDISLGCRCNQGFYGIPPLNSVNSCMACESECSECDQRLVCTDCKAENASPDNDMGCTCNSGYYGDKPLVNATSCSLCSQYNLMCSICNSSNPEICLDCISPYHLQGSQCIECNLTEYFNATTETCDECPILCQLCTSLSNCTECSAHSTLNSEGDCECITGYSGTDSCIETPFIALLTVDITNNLTLLFTSDLNTTLQTSDFNLTINTTPQIYQMFPIDNHTYAITIQFQVNPKAGDKALIVFLTEILSTDNTYLSTKELSAELFAVTSQYSQDELDEVHAYSAIGMAVGVSLTLGGSFMGMDLSTFFNFVNGAEIFTYAVVYDIDLDAQDVAFLNGLRIVPKIPSVFDEFLKAEDGVEMDDYYKNFGFHTSLFMLNQGILISVIMFVVLTIPLFHAIGYVKNEKLHMWLRKFKRYRHSFFFRLWIQSCLEVTMTAFVGIIYNNKANLTQIIDYIICCISIVINI